MPQSAVNVVFGTGSIGRINATGIYCLADLPAIQLILDAVKAHGHYQLDSARAYGGGTSETLLSEADYAKQGFIVDTKVPGFEPGDHSTEKIAKYVAESLKELKTNKVHILYLHSPERTTPFVESLAAINEEYKKGHFEKFGLSNYSAEEVEEFVKIAKENNFVAPTVYQGSYSLAARDGEDKLFQVLRKHGISFYAFSPLAGSFLSGTISREKQNVRFDRTTFVGKRQYDAFCKESYFQALDELEALSKKNGLSIPEISLRWLAHHSQLKREHGDSIIIGGKTLANIQNTLDYLDKPALPPAVLEEVERISRSIVKDAPSYHR